MARIRTIKPEFWDSPDTARASAVARLLFIAMWNWADDAGRGSANLKELEGFAFPNDDVTELSGGTSASFRHVLAEVRDCFDVKFYKVRGRPYYEIPSWRSHQRNERTAKGKYPGVSDGVAWDFMGSDLRSGGTSDNVRRTAAETGAGASERPKTSGPGTGEQGNRGTGEQGNSATPGGVAGEPPSEITPPDGLFDVDPSPNLPAVVEPDNSGDILAAWIDHCGTRDVKLTRRLIGHYAKEIKNALDEGFSPELVKHALASMLVDNVADRPSLLSNRLVAVQTGPERRRTVVRSTTDDRVAGWAALAETLGAA